ncbi:hypothetical protein Bbelb_363650 [Branchiostoma belcheri]|nr:hypothetical protein Bbelb_363650 [Branchiostoma belcheri]
MFVERGRSVRRRTSVASVCRASSYRGQLRRKCATVSDMAPQLQLREVSLNLARVELSWDQSRRSLVPSVLLMMAGGQYVGPAPLSKLAVRGRFPHLRRETIPESRSVRNEAVPVGISTWRWGGTEPDTSNADLNLVATWFQDWALQLHPDKSDQLVEEVTTYTHLGVTMHYTLRWKEHAENVSSKSNKVLGRLSCSIVPGKVTSGNYSAYFTRAWSGASLSGGYGVQHQGQGSSSVDSASTAVVSGIPTPRTRIVPVARCSRRINHTQTLQAIASRNNFYRLSFFPRTIREWNELEPGAVEAGSLAQFKSELARTLLH